MTLYPYVLISLLHVVRSNGNTITVKNDLKYCCDQGIERANNYLNCQLDSTFSAEVQAVCYQSAELCCHQVVREQSCTDGWMNAKYGRDCSSEENTDYIRCCQACKIGMLANLFGNGKCSTKNLHFDKLWQSAFSSCCVASTTNDHGKNITTFPKEDKNYTNQDICQMLPGELCAHKCIPAGLDSYRCICNPGFFLMSDGKSCSPLEDIRCEDCIHGCKMLENNKIICTCPKNMTLAEDNINCIPNTKEAFQKWHCPHGYIHDDNSNKCRDIDECKEGLNDCDRREHICVNMIGSYNCIPKIPPVTCERGFNFSVIHGICEDINECTTYAEDPPCDSSQECQNTFGGYTCNCKEGFTKDPITLACVDINECQENNHNCTQSQRCDNSVGSYFCVRSINCGTGYTLNTNSGICEDDDECKFTNACKFLGDEWECKNTQGSFRCIKKNNKCKNNCKSSHPLPFTHIHDCPSGYKVYGNSCKDINECRDGTATCGQDQSCVNIPGSYLCSDKLVCNKGLKLNEAKSHCIDENECEQEGACQHICQNTWGSYRCLCRHGYVLDTDKKTCIDVDECKLGARCQGYCLNTEGSYTCQCPPGYRLGRNKHSCEDINECEASRSVCQEENEICFNVGGSYRCNAIICPPGYIRDARHKTKCLIKNLHCHIDDYECRRQPRNYMYSYISMVSNYSIPREGHIKLYAVESSWKAASIDFHLDLIKVNAQPGVPKATINDFNLEKQYGRAILELLKPLIGPQQIYLELKSEFHDNRYPLGTSISSIEIYVSKYPY